ncbi:tetratricopeptide repeat protein [Calothrix membranacea FACHB-236]|nr:tetratricopeptide repeat protein [Calothrix membranacea FACHB-236]
MNKIIKRFANLSVSLVSFASLVGLGVNVQAQWVNPDIIPGAPNLPIIPGAPDSDQTNNTNVPRSTINPQLATTYLEQGFQYYQNGEYQSAIAAYNSSLANNPSYAAAYLARAMALHKLGDRYNAYLDARRAAYWSRQQNNQKIYNAAQKFKRAIYR